MLDRIENLRRLKEQCEWRARALAAKGDHTSAGLMQRAARELGWSIANIQAEEQLRAFAAILEN